MKNHIRNFESIAKVLHDEAPNERARLYIEQLVTKISAKGDSWIDANAAQLHIYDSAEQLENMFPVKNNRLWFIAEWQMAVIGVAA